jgi:hypothetical protein
MVDADYSPETQASTPQQQQEQQQQQQQELVDGFSKSRKN